ATHQRLDNEAIATDMPTRLKADASMHQADMGAGLHVAVVELAGNDGLPMRYLLGLCAVHLRPTGEKSSGSGRCGDLVVKSGEGRFEMRGYDRPSLYEPGARIVI